MNKNYFPIKLVIPVILVFFLIVQLTIIFGNKLVQTSESLDTKIYPNFITSNLADIKSSDGQILASKVSTYQIIVDNTDFSLVQIVNSLNNLNEILKGSSNNSFLVNFNQISNQGQIKRSDIWVGEINEVEFLKVKSATLNLDGVNLVQKNTRKYLNNIIYSSFLGYYNSNSASGIENFYSNVLSKENVESLNLSINTKIQQKFEEVFSKNLVNKSASLILQDINSKQIISMLSLPEFDVEKVMKDQTYFENVSKDKSKPLLNKSISETYPTGSIMKIITGLSLLESNAISENSIYHSEGIYMLPGNIPFPEYYKVPYGNLNIVSALRRSSNIFFCKAIQNSDYSNFTKYQTLLGLGNLTGIDLPSEASGIIPTPEYKVSTFGEQWYLGDSCNAVIGQGYTALTSIQMINALSSILTNEKCEPKIANSISYKNGKIEKINQNCKKLDFKIQNINILKQGMREVAKSYNLVNYNLAIKTGTAETGNGNTLPHVWVMGFYPYDNPKYSFILMVENGEKTSLVIDTLREILDSKILDL